MRDKISTREWVLLTLLMGVVQAGIWYISYVNGSNGSALTYVSFAGTLISIILAVLAIGYTYVDSVAQKNNADTTVNQIGILNDAVKNIKVSSQSLNVISDISDKLHSFSESFNIEMIENKEKINSVQQDLKSLIGVIQPQKINLAKSNKKEGQDVDVVLFNITVSDSVGACIYILSSIDGKQYKGDVSSDLLVRTLVEYWTKVDKEVDEITKEHSDSTLHLALGTIMVVFNLFLNLDLFETDGGKFVLTDKFKDEVRSYHSRNDDEYDDPSVFSFVTREAISRTKFLAR